MTTPPTKGRGAVSNPVNRFHATHRETADDGWERDDLDGLGPATTLGVDASRSIITYNHSPDVPFDRSINPFRGCEHGCVYCFARPSHAWLDLSPGLDFETRLFHKPDAPQLLRKELARRKYQCAPIALGVNTDAYQPIERRLRATRAILEVLAETRHPVTLITKSALVERDLDLLGRMAGQGLVQVAISIATLDGELARTLEPRASAPARRLRSIERLHAAGVPVSVMAAPVIPALTDGELERILGAAREASADDAYFALLRLPLEVAPLFEEWLGHHAPGQAGRVMALLRACRGGEVNRGRFGERMKGTGDYAGLIAQRFRLAMKRLGFPGLRELDCSRFRPPRDDGPQLSLFD